MAINLGSLIVKDKQGNVVKVESLSANDKQKIKDYFSKTDVLEQKIAAVNAGQQQLAYKDFYTNEDHKAEMTAGVYYNVPFNAKGEFLEFDPATGKPKSPQTVDTVVDLKVSYYEIVYKSADGTVAKLGRRNADASMEHVLYDNVNETVTGEFTFEKDITMTASQDVDSLGDTKLASAKFVRDLLTKKIAEAQHLTGNWKADGEPQEGTLVTNDIVFFAAVDLL